MRNTEFYIKYKVSYRPQVSPMFSRKNLWLTVLLTLVAALIEPFIVYHRLKTPSFSISHYVQITEFCLAVAVPFVLFLFWLNWREVIKGKRGYNWVGKFKVIKKSASLIFCYLRLAPGNSNLRVERNLFDNVRVGDVIVIRRDALGAVQEVKKVSNFSSRLNRSLQTKYDRTRS
jgi:hypothetical protein